jgi:Zinc knuckle
MRLLENIAREKEVLVAELSELDKVTAYQQYVATAFILGADWNCFRKLLDKLQNDHLQGYNGYPKTLTSAYHLLVNWKGDSSAGYMNDGAAFAITNARQNIDRSNITCFRCGVQGHYANECTDQQASNANGRRNDNNHRNSN